MKKKAFTIAEVLVAVTVMGIIGIGILKLVSNARRTTAIAECRGALRLNAQMAARQIERDIASSRALPDDTDPKKFKMTVEITDGESGTIIKMKSPKSASADDNANNNDTVKYFSENIEDEDKLYADVTYELSNRRLTRNQDGGSTLKIADNIKRIEATGTADLPEGYTYDGKVMLAIIASGKPMGEKDEIEYVEYLTVAIRQLQNKIIENKRDSHFKRRVKASDLTN